MLVFSMMQTPRLWPFVSRMLVGKYIWTTQPGALDGASSSRAVAPPLIQTRIPEARYKRAFAIPFRRFPAETISPPRSTEGSLALLAAPSTCPHLPTVRGERLAPPATRAIRTVSRCQQRMTRSMEISSQHKICGCDRLRVYFRNHTLAPGFHTTMDQSEPLRRPKLLFGSRISSCSALFSSLAGQR